MVTTVHFPRVLLSPSAVAERARDPNIRDSVAETLGCKVCAATRRKYSIKVAILQEILEAMDVDPTDLDEDLFGNILQAMCEQGSAPSTISAYKSALIFYQKVERLWLKVNQSPWAESDFLASLIAGMKARRKRDSSAPQRGQVTNSMFDDLLEWVRSHEPYASDCPLLIHCLIVARGAALRCGQLISIQRDDFSLSDTKSGLMGSLWVRGWNKDPAVRATSTNGKPKLVFDEDAIKSLLLLKSLPVFESPSDLIFDFSPSFLCDLIQKAAVALRWPAGVVWDGPHCLRHAGVAETLAAKPWLNQSPSTVLHYAKPNLSRRKRGRAS